jgi:glycosyltransferase involved in cell wall biosynthesis
MNLTPYFSIGLTTYDRIDLLKQSIHSVLNQSFSDFELIIGNDNPARIINSETLDIWDKRIIFINHAKNLGEVGNMNYMLGISKGSYFTWLGDDDLFAPYFFKYFYKIIDTTPDVDVVFSTYDIITNEKNHIFQNIIVNSDQIRNLSGKEFLYQYFNSGIKIISCYGIFNIQKIKEIGGVEAFDDTPIGLFGEYWLILKCGLLDKIVYIDSPLVIYRSHAGTLTRYMSYIEKKIAAEKLIINCIPLLKKNSLINDFHHNFYELIEGLPLVRYISWAGDEYESKYQELKRRTFFIHKHIRSLFWTKHYWIIMIKIIKLLFQIVYTEKIFQIEKILKYYYRRWFKKVN